MKRTLPVLFLLLTVAGCLRSSFTQQTGFTLEATQVRSVTIEAPSSLQRATVKVSSDVPVSVYIVASKEVPADIEELSQLFLAGKKPSNSFAAEEKVTDKTLEASVPAKTEYQVIVYNPGTKSATVQLTIHGK